MRQCLVKAQQQKMTTGTTNDQSVTDYKQALRFASGSRRPAVLALH
jgi:hypothetical protein